MLLKDKIAVIHGGGGAIGSAVARTFAREGARVFLTGRTQARLDAVVRSIADAGGHARACALDALDDWAVERHADDAARDAGRIDITLNAVGIPHVQGVPFAELTLGDFTHPIHALTRTNFLTAAADTRHMPPGGVVLTISTPGSRFSGAGFLGYGVACAALEAFSRILAGELGPRGIRTVCLRPDAIPEALPTSYAGEVFGRVAARMGTTAEKLLADRARTGTLLGRFPTLSQVAEYAAFAASDRAAAMTGVIANLTCGSLVD